MLCPRPTGAVGFLVFKIFGHTNFLQKMKIGSDVCLKNFQQKKMAK